MEAGDPQTVTACYIGRRQGENRPGVCREPAELHIIAGVAGSVWIRIGRLNERVRVGKLVGLDDVARGRENQVIHVRRQVQGRIVVVYVHVNIEVIFARGEMIEMKFRGRTRRALFDDAVHQPGVGGRNGRWINVVIPTVVRGKRQRHRRRRARTVHQRSGAAVFRRCEIVGVINVIPVGLRNNAGDFGRAQRGRSRIRACLGAVSTLEINPYAGRSKCHRCDNN